jgi:hypothetical protein
MLVIQMTLNGDYVNITTSKESIQIREFPGFFYILRHSV